MGIIQVLTDLQNKMAASRRCSGSGLRCGFKEARQFIYSICEDGEHRPWCGT